MSDWHKGHEHKNNNNNKTLIPSVEIFIEQRNGTNLLENCLIAYFWHRIHIIPLNYGKAK